MIDFFLLYGLSVGSVFLFGVGLMMLSDHEYSWSNLIRNLRGKNGEDGERQERQRWR